MASNLRYHNLYTAHLHFLGEAENHLWRMLGLRHRGDAHAQVKGSLATFACEEALRFATAVADHERKVGGTLGDFVFPPRKPRKATRKRKGVAA